MVDKASIVLSSRDRRQLCLGQLLNYLFWVVHGKSPCSNVNRLFPNLVQNTRNKGHYRIAALTISTFVASVLTEFDQDK